MFSPFRYYIIERIESFSKFIRKTSIQTIKEV